MKSFDTRDDLLDFAISEEEAAAEYYRRLAQEQQQDVMRRVFEDFAREEDGHKKKLLAIKASTAGPRWIENATSMKISDYLVPVEPSKEMDYQEALLLAMVKEKAAFRLYSDLAKVAVDPEIRETLRLLAQEEAAHKLRFEVEYDDVVMKEN